jgi:methylthioribulose-1-phosphate dehydratase
MLGTSGNLSAVLKRDPLRLAITASGVDKGALQPEQIISIDEAARVVGLDWRKPSDESPLHVRLVKERQAGAVFHTHSVWSTMLSDLHFTAGGVAIEGFEMLKGLEGVKTHEHREWIPILENSQDMSALADNIAEKLREFPTAHGLLLHRHGLYTWGKDPKQAKRHVEILEFLCETVVRLRLIERG